MIKKKISEIISFFDEKMKNAFKWSLIGQVFTRSFSLISSLVLAKIMLPDTYGKYIYIIGTIMYLAQMMSLSIRITTTRNVSYLINIDKNKVERYIYISIVLSLIFCFVAFIIALIGVNLFKDNFIVNEYGGIILILSFTALVSEVLITTMIGVLEGLKSFKTLNISSIIVSLLKLILSYFGYLYFGVSGAILGWVISSNLGLLIFTKYLFNSFDFFDLSIFKNSFIKCKEEIKLFFSFSIPSFLEMSILILCIWIIQTIILSEPITGKKEIALYNIANQWKSILIYLPAIIINMLQPFLSDYFGKGESVNIMKLLKKTKRVIIILSVLLSVLFISSSNLIISFYGESYYEASKVLVILILPIIFININALNRQFLISIGKIWQIAIINFISATTIITSFILLKDNFPLSVSFAVSVGIGEFLSFCLYLYALKSLLNKKNYLLN